MKTFRPRWMILLPVCLALATHPAAQGNYDPLTVPPKFEAQLIDLVVHDAKRNRDLPVLIYLPHHPLAGAGGAV
jgi:hypothetical protein